MSSVVVIEECPSKVLTTSIGVFLRKLNW